MELNATLPARATAVVDLPLLAGALGASVGGCALSCAEPADREVACRGSYQPVGCRVVPLSLPPLRFGCCYRMCLHLARRVKETGTNRGMRYQVVSETTK